MNRFLAISAPGALGLMAALVLPDRVHAEDATLPRVTVVAIDAQASEAGDVANFMLTREGGDITKPLTVPFALSGSAASGADYANPGTSVTFVQYSPFVSVTIKPVKDSLTEGTETVVLTLSPKPGQYMPGDERSAQATITDVPPNGGSTSGTPGKGSPVPPPPINDPFRNLPPPDRIGSLVVSMTWDGAGSWRHPKNGTYSNMKFHRVLTYTVPLRGTYAPMSGLTEIDRREPKGALYIPNFKRYLVLEPRDLMGPAGRVCGQGTTDFLDEASGMQVGDPGQPPLVPFHQTIKGGGLFPSGDKTVPERDLCMTRVSLDFDKHVFHVILDGSDSNVKIVDTNNGHSMPPGNLPLQGYDNGGAKAKLTWYDVPLQMSAGGHGFEGSRVIENFNTVSGHMSTTTFPLRATVKYRLTLN